MGWELLYTPLADLRGWRAWVGRLGVVLLFALGVYWFGVLFNWGVHDVTFMDWAEITAPRLTFLRDAVVTAQLPLHISDPGTFHAISYRYLAVPDTFLSPQALLLLRMSITRFNFFNVLLTFGAGYLGLLVLARRLRLSLVTFAFAALVLNFNGNLLAHFAIGHVMWTVTFLFPWFVWLTLRLADGERSWAWTFQMALLLLIIWLQGGFHQYLWLLLLLAALGLSLRGAFLFCLRAGVFALLLSAVRILPASSYSTRYAASFITGYPSLFALWDALVNPGNQLDGARFFPFGFEGTGAWEISAYIGLSAALLLVVFGIWYGLLHPSAPYRRLAPALGIILLLSIGSFYGWLRLIPLSILQGERVSTRILLVPLAFLTVLAAERIQRWVEGKPIPNLWGTARGVMAFALALAFNDFWYNIRMWSVLTVQEASWWVYFDKKKWFVLNQWDDTRYLVLAAAGLSLSLVTLGVLGWLAWRERRQRLQAGDGAEPTP